MHLKEAYISISQKLLGRKEHHSPFSSKQVFQSCFLNEKGWFFQPSYLANLTQFLLFS